MTDMNDRDVAAIINEAGFQRDLLGARAMSFASDKAVMQRTINAQAKRIAELEMEVKALTSVNAGDDDGPHLG